MVVGLIVFRGLHFETTKEDQKKLKESVSNAKDQWQGAYISLQRLRDSGTLSDNEFSLTVMTRAGHPG